MPRHIGSSQVKGENLRLMQSVLGPAFILMGSTRATDLGDGTQGSAGGASEPEETAPGGQSQEKIQPGKKRQELLLAECVQTMLTVMLVLLARVPESTAFRAYDCNNQSTQIKQYSLLDPEPCGNMERVHAID
jgi:hypothetical protein